MRRAEAQTRLAFPKIPRAPSVFPIKGHLRRQAINLTSSRRVKAWGNGLPRLEVCPETKHTRPDSYRLHHGRPKCVPSTGFPCITFFYSYLQTYKWQLNDILSDRSHMRSKGFSFPMILIVLHFIWVVECDW